MHTTRKRPGGRWASRALRLLLPLTALITTFTTTTVRAEDSSLWLAPAPQAVDQQEVARAASAARKAEAALALTESGPPFTLPAIVNPASGDKDSERRSRDERRDRDAALEELAGLVTTPAGVPTLVAEWRALSRAQRMAFFDAVIGAGYDVASRAATVEDCPQEAPEGTLRGGSAVLGVHNLCVRSVLAAPTPQAAIAIKFAFWQLGTPYSLEQRNRKGFFDCSSLVMRAYASAGMPGVVRGGSLTTRTIAPYPGFESVPWLADVAWDDRLPGDLVLTPPLRADGGGHVMLQLVDGFILHASTEGDVVHIRTEYPEDRIDYVRRVDPPR